MSSTAVTTSPAETSPAARDFPGLDEFVERLDDAVTRDTVEDITAGVQATLTDMLGDGRLRPPADVLEAQEGCYARRLLYRSEEHGYVAIAMVWGPEQATPLHDHDGVWCVEGVLQGEIEVTRYEPIDREGERWHFRPDETLHAHVGVSGTLIPPFEYHTISNKSSAGTAITIHVYGREMEKSSVFEPRGEGWYERVEHQLGYN